MNKDHRELYVVSWTLRLGALRHICKKHLQKTNGMEREKGWTKCENIKRNQTESKMRHQNSGQ